MATITWEQLDARCGDDDNITVIIQELSDGNPTGKQYSARKHKDRPVEEFQVELKERVLEDRAKTGKAGTFSGKLDLTGFETFINE